MDFDGYGAASHSVGSGMTRLVGCIRNPAEEVGKQIFSMAFALDPASGFLF